MFYVFTHPLFLLLLLSLLIIVLNFKISERVRSKIN